MILQGNEDLRVRKTIQGIKNAFEELICEKEYERITVKELCDKAQINPYPRTADRLAHRPESAEVNKRLSLWTNGGRAFVKGIICNEWPRNHARRCLYRL